MDRFLDGRDEAGTDFVRREYRLALELGKNIVPVINERFGAFPDAARLPEDVRPIIRKNGTPWLVWWRHWRECCSDAAAIKLLP